MNKIFLREIGVVTENSQQAIDIFENGMRLKLKHINPTSRIYLLSNGTRLNVWTGGRKPPLSQKFLQFYADEEIILNTAKILKKWKRGVSFKRMKSADNQPYLLLRVNLQKGSDISFSNLIWREGDLEN